METRSRKRNRRDNNEVKPKRFQTDVKAPKHFTDLNEDVLAQIFEYLEIDEMVNTAKASKIFLKSIQRAFKRKYRNKYIQIPLGDTTKAFKRSLEVIRYFGKDIPKLKLNYGILECSRNKQIHDLVMEVCHATIIDINFHDLSPDLKIIKCFSKLKTLEINSGLIDASVCKLVKWFPIVEKFMISCVKNIVTNKQSKFDTKRNIPSLKCFKTDFCLFSNNKFNIQQINDFIKFNPQLNELSLTLDKDMFSTTKKTTRSGRKSVPISVHNAIVCETMMTVELLMYSGNLAELVIPYDRIKQLELRSVTCETHVQICTFIANCVNLKILKLNMDMCCRNEILRDTFTGAAWIDYAKHVQLTQLEISFKASRRTYGSFSIGIGLMAIQPYLQDQCELNTVKLTYPGKRCMPDANFDAFTNQINLKLWSLTHAYSNDQISLTLNKLSK